CSLHHDMEADFVLDPVCGMKVNPGSAKHTCEHDGRQYFFCGQRCLTKFQAEPAKYLKLTHEHPAPKAHPHDTPQRPADGQSVYTCPMHSEIRRPGPGSCPQCGMALEPLTVGPLTARTEYIC